MHHGEYASRLSRTSRAFERRRRVGAVARGAREPRVVTDPRRAPIRARSDGVERLLSRPLAPDRRSPFAIDASAQEAREWLDKMNRAVEELNYQGTFVHVLDGTRRNSAHHSSQRGRPQRRAHRVARRVGREIIRQDDEVQCILPDRRVVLLEERKESSPLVSALPSYSAEIEPHYELTLHSSARVANRPAQVLEIKPRDEFRYGYMLWLDQETAMPLKSQLIDDKGEIVEQILFTEIDMPDSIPPRRSPPRSTRRDSRCCGRPSRRRSRKAFRGERPRCPAASSCRSQRRARSRARKLPSSISSIPTVSRPCRCSSRIRTRRPRSVKASRTLGSTNAFSLTLRGRKVTAVGEVPRQTVRTIASSLVSE